MAAALRIREFPQGLCIRVTASVRVGRAFLCVSVGSVAACLFAYFANGPRLVRMVVVGLCALYVGWEVVSEFRGTEVELRVDNLDFSSLGHAPGGYNPSIIPRADVDRLEFRKGSGGGDDPVLPEGLYVEHRGGVWNAATCVLPHLNKAQTEEAIEAIYRRFPDTGTLAPSDRYKSHLTVLNLSQPEEPKS
jgi:hypothetical protein